MRPNLLLAVCAITLASLAGCFSDEPDEDDDTGPDDLLSGTVGAGGNGTGNGTRGSSGNVTGNATTTTTTSPPVQNTTTWTSQNETGTVSGLGLVVSTPNSTEQWRVENGTLQLVLNLTASGGELDLAVRPPDCTSDSCLVHASTHSGKATLTVVDPDGGAWAATLTPRGGVGPVMIDYTLNIAMQVTMQAASMTGPTAATTTTTTTSTATGTATTTTTTGPYSPP